MKALSCRPGEGNKRRADLRDDGLSCLPSAREGREEPQKLTRRFKRRRSLCCSRLKWEECLPSLQSRRIRIFEGIRGSNHRKSYFLQLVRAEAARGGRRRMLGCDTFADGNPFPNSRMRKCLMQNGRQRISHISIFSIKFFRNNFEGNLKRKKRSKWNKKGQESGLAEEMGNGIRKMGCETRNWTG